MWKKTILFLGLVLCLAQLVCSVDVDVYSPVTRPCDFYLINSSTGQCSVSFIFINESSGPFGEQYRIILKTNTSDKNQSFVFTDDAVGIRLQRGLNPDYAVDAALPTPQYWKTTGQGSWNNYGFTSTRLRVVNLTSEKIIIERNSVIQGVNQDFFNETYTLGLNSKGYVNKYTFQITGTDSTEKHRIYWALSGINDITTDNTSVTCEDGRPCKNYFYSSDNLTTHWKDYTLPTRLEWKNTQKANLFFYENGTLGDTTVDPGLEITNTLTRIVANSTSGDPQWKATWTNDGITTNGVLNSFQLQPLGTEITGTGDLFDAFDDLLYIEGATPCGGPTTIRSLRTDATTIATLDENSTTRGSFQSRSSLPATQCLGTDPAVALYINQTAYVYRNKIIYNRTISAVNKYSIMSIDPFSLEPIILTTAVNLTLFNNITSLYIGPANTSNENLWPGFDKESGFYMNQRTNDEITLAVTLHQVNMTLHSISRRRNTAMPPTFAGISFSNTSLANGLYHFIAVIWLYNNSEYTNKSQAAVDHYNDYQNPSTLVAIQGSQDTGAGGDHNHDGFNEYEGVYEWNATTNEVEMNMTSCTPTRPCFDPVFRIKNWSDGSPPGVLMINDTTGPNGILLNTNQSSTSMANSDSTSKIFYFQYYGRLTNWTTFRMRPIILIQGFSLNPPKVVNQSWTNITANITVLGGTVDKALADIYAPNGSLITTLTLLNGTNSVYSNFTNITVPPYGSYRVNLRVNITRGESNNSENLIINPYRKLNQNVTVTIDGSFGDWDGVLNTTDPIANITNQPAFTEAAYHRPINVTGASYWSGNASFDRFLNDTTTFIKPSNATNLTFILPSTTTKGTLYVTALNLSNTTSTADATIWNWSSGKEYAWFTLNRSLMTRNIVLTKANGLINGSGLVIVQFKPKITPLVYNITDAYISTYGQTNDFRSLTSPTQPSNATNASSATLCSTQTNPYCSGSSPVELTLGAYRAIALENDTRGTNAQILSSYAMTGDGTNTPITVYHFNITNTTDSIKSLTLRWRGNSSCQGICSNTAGVNFFIYSVYNDSWQPIQSVSYVNNNVSTQIINILNPVSYINATKSLVHILAEGVSGSMVWTDYVSLTAQPIDRDVDIESVKIANNATHLFGYMRLNGSVTWNDPKTYYRMFLSTHENTTNTSTPDTGQSLPFEWTHRIEINDTACTIWNYTNTTSSGCTYAISGNQLEFQVPLVKLDNVSYLTPLNVSFETGNNRERLDIAPDYGSFISYTVNGSLSTPITFPVGMVMILNSTYGTNLTTENFTAYAQNISTPLSNGSEVAINWLLNGKSMLLINLEMDNYTESSIRKTHDFSGYDRHGILDWNTSITMYTKYIYSNTTGTSIGLFHYNKSDNLTSVMISNTSDLWFNHSFAMRAVINLSNNTYEPVCTAFGCPSITENVLGSYNNDTGFQTGIQIKKTSGNNTNYTAICYFGGQPGLEISGPSGVVSPQFSQYGLYDIVCDLKLGLPGADPERPGANITLYLNGNLSRSSAFNINPTSCTICSNLFLPINFTQNFTIGYEWLEAFKSTKSTNVLGFNGSIFKAQIYNHTLTKSSVELFYQTVLNLSQKSIGGDQFFLDDNLSCFGVAIDDQGVNGSRVLCNDINVSATLAQMTSWILRFPTGCNLTKGDQDGDGVCDNCWFETSDLVGIAEQSNVSCEGQSVSTPFVSIDHQGIGNRSLNFTIWLNQSVDQRFTLKVSQKGDGYQSECSGNPITGCKDISNTTSPVWIKGGVFNNSDSGLYDASLWLFADFWGALSSQGNVTYNLSLNSTLG